jgi:hypothetical protein
MLHGRGNAAIRLDKEVKPLALESPSPGIGWSSQVQGHTVFPKFSPNRLNHCALNIIFLDNLQCPSSSSSALGYCG